MIVPLYCDIWFLATTSWFDSSIHQYPPNIPVTLIPTDPITRCQKYFFSHQMTQIILVSTELHYLLSPPGSIPS